MQIHLYATLRLKTGRAAVEVQAGPGDTVRDAIHELLDRHPVLSTDVLTDKGELTRHIHVFLDGRNVRLLDGLDTVIRQGDKLEIFAAVGGGGTLV